MGSPEMETLKILIGGKWQSSRATRFGQVFNPSTGAAIARVPFSSAAEVAEVIESAAAAFPAWAATPAVDRAHLLFRYRELLLKNFEKLALTVCREHGKTITEARASVQRGIEVIEFACGAPSLPDGTNAPRSGSQC